MNDLVDPSMLANLSQMIETINKKAGKVDPEHAHLGPEVEAQLADWYARGGPDLKRFEAVANREHIRYWWAVMHYDHKVIEPEDGILDVFRRMAPDYRARFVRRMTAQDLVCPHPMVLKDPFTGEFEPWSAHAE
jgi:hypothetical protein